MRRTVLTRALPLGLLGALVIPAAALADAIKPDGSLEPFPRTAAINSVWLVVAAMVVMFMQAGFAFLEIGFSRGKNAGTVIAKILTNFSIAGLGYWAVGFAFAFGADPSLFGSHALHGLIGSRGFFLRDFGDATSGFPVMGVSNATVEAKWFFQFVFCAVSLAIVWGTTLERIKFGVYVIYAIVFSTVIYPVASHWVFGGGFLQQGHWLGTGINGIQDFAGSTAVHLIGATGALAALLLLGPRKGKYGPDGAPRAIPGHNMPLFGLGVIILWLGWFGFNPGSTLGAMDGRFTQVILVTQLAACAGVLAAVLTARIKTKAIDIGMAGNGAIAALVAITAPSGYVEPWTAPIIGAVAGVIVVLGVYWVDKHIDDPVGALSAHGMAGIWGTISCGFFTAPKLAKYNAFGDPRGGLIYSKSVAQLIAQVVGFTITFTFVFILSYATFWVIKKTYGLRVTEEEEDAGLDISEHGMYGYPEQFIPAPELIGWSPRGESSGAGAAPYATEVPS